MNKTYAELATAIIIAKATATVIAIALLTGCNKTEYRPTEPFRATVSSVRVVETNTTLLADSSYLPQPNPEDRCDDECTEHPFDVDTNATVDSQTLLAVTIIVDGEEVDLDHFRRGRNA